MGRSQTTLERTCQTPWAAPLPASPTPLGNRVGSRVVLSSTPKGNPAEASPVSGTLSPFGQGVPCQSKQSQLYDCALAGVGENKDPFLCFPKSMSAAKGAVYTIFPGEEFVPFLSRLQLEKIDSLPAYCFFPSSLGRKEVQYPNHLPSREAHLGITRAFCDGTENHSFGGRKSTPGREGGRGDREPGSLQPSSHLFHPSLSP